MTWHLLRDGDLFYVELHDIDGTVLIQSLRHAEPRDAFEEGVDRWAKQSPSITLKTPREGQLKAVI